MGLYFSLLGISLIMILWAVGILRGDGGPGTIYLEMVASLAMAVLVILWCQRTPAEIRPLLRRVGAIRWYALAMLLGGTTFVVASLAVAGIHRLLGGETLELSHDFERAGFSFATAVALVCVHPAVFEELAFRGVILGALDRALTPRESAVVTALLFGILHLSVPSLCHLALLGLTLAWLRRLSGSLYPCMLMHFTHNLLALLNERNGWTPW